MENNNSAYIDAAALQKTLTETTNKTDETTTVAPSTANKIIEQLLTIASTTNHSHQEEVTYQLNIAKSGCPDIYLLLALAKGDIKENDESILFHKDLIEKIFNAMVAVSYDNANFSKFLLSLAMVTCKDGDQIFNVIREAIIKQKSETIVSMPLSGSVIKLNIPLGEQDYTGSGDSIKLSHACLRKLVVAIKQARNQASYEAGIATIAAQLFASNSSGPSADFNSRKDPGLPRTCSYESGLRLWGEEECPSPPEHPFVSPPPSVRRHR